MLRMQVPTHSRNIIIYATLVLTGSDFLIKQVAAEPTYQQWGTL